jgi:hypothetical protein
MQTFLPFHSIPQSINTLDNVRLNKQRFEAKDILFIILHKQGGTYYTHDPDALIKTFQYTDKYAAFIVKRYQNHPAVAMWREFPTELFHYCVLCNGACNQRNFVDTNKNYIKFIQDLAAIDLGPEDHTKVPPFLAADSPLQRTHAAALLKKSPTHYNHLTAHYANLTPVIDYIWWRPEQGFYRIKGNIHYNV